MWGLVEAGYSGYTARVLHSALVSTDAVAAAFNSRLNSGEGLLVRLDAVVFISAEFLRNEASASWLILKAPHKNRRYY